MTNLAQAYQGARYYIDTPSPILIIIDQPQPDLQALHQQHRCTHSHILTPCNPHSRRLRPAANLRRLAALRHRLDILSATVLPTHNTDPTGQWPDEPGFWIAGLPPHTIRMLAKSFGQNAWVLCPADTIAQLQWAAG
ncbi:DUF3293 domain-containing protein [Castellaniella sp.]|jgi:hypothetical protein|uniref:DUF3293 domain-containing protein n=1 Tax=Castellaniella sp. TaxID=1955812 RepID=UPI003A8DF8D0